MAHHPIEPPAKVLLLLAATVVVGAVTWLYLPFFLGQKNFFHDSLVPATLIGLFYDRAYSGDSWLWSAALNSGHPIWVNLETAPFFDPVAMAVYSLAIAFDGTWLPPYYMTAFVWLFVYAAGGALCAREITNSHEAALLVFILLMCGPMVLIIPGASNGFLIPFRYFGLTAWLYLRMRRKTSSANILGFTTILSFSMSGYLTVYTFIMFFALLVAELIVGRLRFLKWLRLLIRPQNIAFLLTPPLDPRAAASRGSDRRAPAARKGPRDAVSARGGTA